MPFGAIAYGLAIVTIPAILAGFAIWAIVRRPLPASFSLDPIARTSAGRVHTTFRLATIIGLIAAFWSWGSFTHLAWVVLTDPPGLMAALAPILAGLLFLAVVAVREASWPHPSGATRSATLTRRPVIARAAQVPHAATWLWAAVLATTLIISGVTAAPDGRSIAHLANTFNPTITGASGPFPGWPYGVPILLAAALLIASSLGASHLVARRPAVPGLSRADDDALRLISATRIAKATQLALAVTVAGVLWFAAAALGNAGWGWAWPCAFVAAAVLASGFGVATRPARLDEPTIGESAFTGSAGLR